MGRPRKQPETGRDVFTPIDSFTAAVDGTDMPFVKGQTYVREGHPVLDKYPGLFERLHVHYDVEQATAAPEETRA